MKKFFLMILIIFSILLNLLSTAYATQFAEPPPGALLEVCDLSFKVTDKTGNFTDDIGVRFKDISDGREYPFLLKYENGFAGEWEMPANTTYEVIAVLRSDNRDNYNLKNSDGTEITSYHATTEGLPITWEITKREDSAEAVGETTGDNEGQGASVTTNSDQEGQSVNNSIIELTGEELVNHFIEKTKFIENDEGFETVFVGGENPYKNPFLEIQGNTEEIWKTMSRYDKICYLVLVTYPRTLLLGGNSSVFAANKEMFTNEYLNLLSSGANLVNGGVEEVSEALKDVAEWHWNNWETNHIVINPYENTVYEDIVQEENEFELTEEEKEELLEDLSEEDIEALNEDFNEISSKNNFFNIIKSNMISIAIFLIVGGVLAFVIIKNKKKNYDDN